MQLDPETSWAYWARNIYINRYMKAPKPVYEMLLELVKEKDYFVITTNVDHQFQKAGFDKKWLFYTQGDYGLFQSVNPAIRKTYDNEEWVMKAMEAQGFILDEAGVFQLPEDGKINTGICATSCITIYRSCQRSWCRDTSQSGNSTASRKRCWMRTSITSKIES